MSPSARTTLALKQKPTEVTGHLQAKVAGNGSANRTRTVGGQQEAEERGAEGTSEVQERSARGERVKWRARRSDRWARDGGSLHEVAAPGRNSQLCPCPTPQAGPWATPTNLLGTAAPDVQGDAPGEPVEHSLSRGNTSCARGGVAGKCRKCCGAAKRRRKGHSGKIGLHHGLCAIRPGLQGVWRTEHPPHGGPSPRPK